MNFFYAVNAAHAAAVTPGGIVTSGLIWHIDPTDSLSYPGSGSTIYDLVGSNNGTFEGGTYVDGNGHLRLDGVNDGIYFGSIAPANPLSLVGVSYTFSAWVYNNGTGEAYQQAFSQWDASGNRLQVVRETATRGVNIRCDVNASVSEVTHTFASTNNAWEYWVHIFDISTGTVLTYVNSTYIGSGTIFATNNVTKNMRLGARADNISRAEWNGRLGAYLVYNRALNSTEIAQNFDATKGAYGL